MSTQEYNKVLRYFFDFPSQRIHVRELARRTGLSPMGAAKILKRLKKNKLIVSEETKAATFYKANLGKDEFLAQKRIGNLTRILNSKLLKNLIKFYRNPEAIVLFGGYAEGTDIEKSDIDILVLSRSEEEFLGLEYQKEFNRPVNIIKLSTLSKASKEFINNLANGFILYGYLKVIL